jgi:hypothetical protein
MKAATLLAAWAVGTFWLVAYVVTHHANHQLGLDDSATLVIRAGSFVLGLVLFPLVRQWFQAWLDKSRGT